METVEQVNKRHLSDRDTTSSTSIFLCILIVVAVIARFFIAFNYEVNWDEFYYLSFVHRFINGEVINSFQTFHIHFFTWLSGVSDNDVDQIIVARVVMVFFQLLTGFYLYKLCRLYCSKSAALFAVLAYFSFVYNVRMGASFRTDPIATCMIMAALYYVFSTTFSWRVSILAGVLTAVALLVTLKTALYIPTFIGIVLTSLYWSRNRKRYFRQVLMYGVAILVAFAMLYSWHYFSIHGASSVGDAGTMFGAADKTLNQRELFPRLFYFVHSVSTNSWYWLALFIGIGTAVYACFSQKLLSRESSIKFLCLSLLLFTLLFYRNAFPYYYAFMLAPVSALFAVAWVGIQNFTNARVAQFFNFIVPCLFAVSIVVNGFVLPIKSNLAYQRQFLDEVHKIFPQPVAYIDRCSMVPTFSKQGFFMSTWGYEDYIARNIPVIRNAIEQDNPAFVLVNSHYLDVFGPDKTDKGLLRQDIQALRQNYIHHWSHLYVAGKTFELTSNSLSREVKVNIEGVYTLEASNSLLINGKVWLAGQARYLARGVHELASKEPGKVVLRWGDNLYRPRNLEEKQRLFTGF